MIHSISATPKHLSALTAALLLAGYGAAAVRAQRRSQPAPEAGGGWLQVLARLAMRAVRAPQALPAGSSATASQAAVPARTRSRQSPAAAALPANGSLWQPATLRALAACSATPGGHGAPAALRG